FPSRLDSRCLVVSTSSSFSFHRRSNSPATRRFLASTASYCSNAFLASYSSCSSLLDRAARCAASPALNSSSAFRLASTPKGEITFNSSWPNGGLPRHRQNRGNTGLHRHSLLCRDNAHWCRCLPSSARVACDHTAHTAEAPPEGLARHGSRPSIRRLASSLNCAGSCVDSLRTWPSQYNPRDDRG